MAANSTISATGILAGRNILVTRPAHQADNMCSLIESEAGTAVRFPVITISATQQPTQCESRVRQIDRYNMAVFVSPNAVEYAQRLASFPPAAEMPAGLRIAAVGKATAASLAKLGFMVEFVPDNTYNSESLLAELINLPLSGMKVIIFRGNGGRELLGDGLTDAGARVEYCEVYRRSRPDTQLLLPHKQSENAIHLVTVTSGKGVINLFDLTTEPQLSRLRDIQFLVGSERVASVVRELGCRHEPILAENPGDQAMFSAICDWAGSVELRK